MSDSKTRPSQARTRMPRPRSCSASASCPHTVHGQNTPCCYHTAPPDRPAPPAAVGHGSALACLQQLPSRAAVQMLEPAVPPLMLLPQVLEQEAVQQMDGL